MPSQQFDGISGMKVVVVGDVLLDYQLPEVRQCARPHVKQRHTRLPGIGHADSAAVKSVLIHPYANVSLMADIDQRPTRHVGDGVAQPGCTGPGQDRVRQPLGGVGPVKGLIEISVAIGGGDEYGYAYGHDCSDRREAPPFPPHVATYFATQCAAHQSNSDASTGFLIISVLLIAPECSHRTRSAMRAISELWVTTMTVC